MLRPSITPNWKAGRWVDRTNKHNWKQYLYRDLFRYVVLINPYIRPSGRVNKYLQTKAGINYVQPQPANSGNECGISCTVAVEKLNRLLFQLFLSLRISPLWPRPNGGVTSIKKLMSRLSWGRLSPSSPGRFFSGAPSSPLAWFIKLSTVRFSRFRGARVYGVFIWRIWSENILSLTKISLWFLVSRFSVAPKHYKP